MTRRSLNSLLDYDTTLLKQPLKNTLYSSYPINIIELTRIFISKSEK